MSQLHPIRDAFIHFLERCIAFLPNLLTTSLLLILGWVLGRLLAAGARHLIRKLRFDQVLEKAGWTEALERNGVAAAPSELVARLIHWTVGFVFAVLAVQNLGLALEALPVESFLEFLPRVLGAILLLFLGSVVAGVVSGALGTALAKIRFSQHKLISNGMRAAILLITLTMAIEHLGFDLSLFTGLMVNLLTIFAAALAFTFALAGRQPARNLLAGYYARERFTPGQVLELDDGKGHGELLGIGTLTSEIRTESGTVIFPNSILIETPIRRSPDQDSDG